MQKDIGSRLAAPRSYGLRREYVGAKAIPDSRLDQRDFEPLVARIRADAARIIERVQHFLNARDRQYFLVQPRVGQALRAMNSLLGNCTPDLLTDKLEDAFGCKTCKPVREFLTRDLIAVLAQYFAVDTCGNDFGIDQDSVAVEDNQPNAAGLSGFACAARSLIGAAGLRGEPALL